MVFRQNRSAEKGLKLIFLCFLLFTTFVACGYNFQPTIFQITSMGGDSGSEHEISFALIYAGNVSSTLDFPTSSNTIASQCPNGQGNQNDVNCDMMEGQATPLKNLGPMQIPQNATFSSLFLNVVEHDTFGNDRYTTSISSENWKLSSGMCIPYEVRIPVAYAPEVKVKSCFSMDLTLTAEISKSFGGSNSTSAAEASLSAEFKVGWQKCSEWTEPQKSYVLYIQVTNNSPYPNISHVISVCSSSRIATKDFYNNTIFPFNPVNIPSWIIWDNESYIAKPEKANVGNHTVTLGVFGPCGAKNITVLINVQPEQNYPAHSFSVDACAAAKLTVKDSFGNLATPASPGASKNWIIMSSSQYVATPTQAQVGQHDVTLTVGGACGAKNVSAKIIVNPQKKYSDISYNLKACSSVRLTANNALGIPIPPSANPTIQHSWIVHDAQGYIAKPLNENIGTWNVILSMFSYCGPRNITASIIVTASEDFLVDKKFISVFDNEETSYHNLNILPSTKALSCENFTSSSNQPYDWVSVSETGTISLSPRGVAVDTYKLTGICADKCGRSKKAYIEIQVKAVPSAQALLKSGVVALMMMLVMVVIF